MKYFTSVLFKYFVVRYELARDRKEMLQSTGFAS